MQPELFSQNPAQFTIYLARHASPDRTRVDLPYHIPPGPELTERGRQEAAQLAAFLERTDAARVYASPLERAWRTASISSERSGVPLELDLDLAEWRPDESEKMVAIRARRAFDRAAQISFQAGAAVILVTHGGPVLALLKQLGMPVEMAERCRLFDSRNPIPMAGAWRIARQDGMLRMALVFAPDTVTIPAHMPAEWLVEQGAALGQPLEAPETNAAGGAILGGASSAAN